jgi:hypothetical protein
LNLQTSCARHLFDGNRRSFRPVVYLNDCK